MTLRPAKKKESKKPQIPDEVLMFERACIAAAKPGSRLQVPGYDFLTVRLSKSPNAKPSVQWRQGSQTPIKLGQIGKKETAIILRKYRELLQDVREGVTITDLENEQQARNMKGLTHRSSFYDVAEVAIKHKEGGTCKQWDKRPVGAGYARTLKYTLKNYFQGLRNVPLCEVEKEHIARVITAANTAAPKGNVANSCRNIVLAVQRFAAFHWQKQKITRLLEVEIEWVESNYEEHAGFNTLADIAYVDELLESKLAVSGLIWTQSRRIAADCARLMMHYGGRGGAFRYVEKGWVDIPGRKIFFPEEVMKVATGDLGSGVYDHELFLTDTAIEIITPHLKNTLNDTPFLFPSSEGTPIARTVMAGLLDKLYELDKLPLGTYGHRDLRKPVSCHGLKATAVRGMYLAGAGDPDTIKLTTNTSKAGEAKGSQMHYLPKNHVVTEDKKTRCLIIYEGAIRRHRGLPPRRYDEKEVFAHPEATQPYVTFF